MKRLLVAVALLASAATAFGQGFRFGFGRNPGDPEIENPAYDGRFTFARLKYTSGPGGYYYYGLPAWAHGFVSRGGGGRAEENLMRIMNEVTYLKPRIDDSVVVAVDDPELCRYPVAYMTEEGFWTLNEREAVAFGAYLRKGGFVIFDDFRADGQFNSGGGWANFAANMHRVLPDAQIVDLDPSHPIFHSFFEITSFDIVPQAYDRGKPVFRGVFEDNDPAKRLMAIVNYNTDVAQYWEFSATGFRPIDEANEAYKLGVNYVMYGLTH
jgi:Domain of unknown function (DUF4159)